MTSRRPIGVVIAILASLAAAPALLAQSAITDVGTLGGDTSALTAINDRGHAVGWSTVTFSETDRAMLWQDGQLIDLGALPGDTTSRALAINERDQIVGMSIDFGLARARAVLWDGGVATDIGITGAGVCRGAGINNRGHVAGSCDSAGWLWRDGEHVELGLLPGYTFSGAAAINDRDVIVGRMSDGLGRTTAFRWQDGRLTDLGAVTGVIRSEAIAINARGQIVGTAVFADNGETEPVLWDNGTLIRLGATMGTSRGVALGINDRGEIVGEARRIDGSGGGFVWVGGRFQFFDAPGYACDISNAGVAAGQYTTADVIPEIHGAIWPKALTRVAPALNAPLGGRVR